MRNTVLMVDDEPAGLKVLEALLGPHENLTLLAASEGQGALDLAVRCQPDLILLDVMMPGMDGFEVCRRLRANVHTAEVPILLLTALDGRESRLQGIRAGADDFITKPYDRGELRMRVQSILRLNRYRRLQEQRLRFSWVVDQDRDGYVLINQDDSLAYLNTKARQYLGLESEAPLEGLCFLQQARSLYRLEPAPHWIQWPLPPQPGEVRYLVRPESAQACSFWLQVDLLDSPDPRHDTRMIRLCDVTSEMTSQCDVRTFHRTLSHKLLTPVNNVLGFLELLSQQRTANPPIDPQECVNLAFQSAQGLSRKLSDILTYLSAPALAEPGSGFVLDRLPLLVQEIALQFLLQPIRLEISPELAGKSLVLSEQAMELILWEVFENSKKFHPANDPEVEIRVQPAPGQQVHLTILDNGVHLSPDQLNQVMTPYYQGEKYFTGETAGMGLGLASVAVMTWRAGGNCRLFNRQGPGIGFELFIPEVMENIRVTQRPFTS